MALELPTKKNQWVELLKIKVRSIDYPSDKRSNTEWIFPL